MAWYREKQKRKAGLSSSFPNLPPSQRFQMRASGILDVTAPDAASLNRMEGTSSNKSLPADGLEEANKQLIDAIGRNQMQRALEIVETWRNCLNEEPKVCKLVAYQDLSLLHLLTASS